MGSGSTGASFTLPSRCCRMESLADATTSEVGSPLAQPQAQASLAPTGIASSRKLQTFFQPDESRQTLGSAVAGDDAEIDLGLTEHQRGAHNPGVACCRRISAPPPRTGPSTAATTGLPNPEMTSRTSWPRRHFFPLPQPSWSRQAP